MGKFLTPLHMREDSGFCVRLSKPLLYVSAVEFPTATYCVPKGFRSDFASIPRFLWPIIPPHGRVKKAAVLHDWLYTQPQIPRSLADRIFLEAMAADNVPTPQRWIMYEAVRLFGWIHRRQ